MSRRLLKHHQDDVRAKIKAGAIIQRLEQCINGEIELSATQVRAAGILLDKSVASLVATTISGDPDNPIQLSMTASQQLEERLARVGYQYDELGPVQPH